MRKMSDELLNQVKVFIKNFVDDNGYPPSVRDVCSGLNIKSTATVFKYINKLDEIGELQKAPAKTRAINVLDDRYKRDKFEQVPLLGNIAAGTPITAVENIEEVYDLPTKLFQGELFMLTVKGTSMIDVGIFNGDKVIIRKTETADNGEIVAALIDDEATVKRFYKEKDYIRLHPENQQFEDIIVNDCKILGKIVGLIRQY